MATRQATIDLWRDALAGSGELTMLRMFGEYCLYLDRKPVALICRDRLYVKPTEAGRAVAFDVAAEPPFPGIRPYLLIPDEWADRWEHREKLRELLRRTSDHLPCPQPRRRRSKR